MEDKLVYQCEKCGKAVVTSGGDAPTISECCEAPVKSAKELPFCTTAPSAEHARGGADDEPCDDGRAGKV